MRNLSWIFAPLFLLQVNNANAQNAYNFNFNHSLWDSSAHQKMTAVCTPSYSDHTFIFGKIKITRPVCHFDKQCGFIFNDTSNFIQSGSYTIELYTELDSISGYRKLIDYKNLSVDMGLYDNDDACTFRGPGTVSGDLFTRGAYAFVVITRDGATKTVKLFVNGSYVDGFNDADFDYAVYDASKTLRFLQDDNYSTGMECSSGNIAMLTIYNTAIDDGTVKSHYAALPESLKIKAAEPIKK